MNNPHGDVDKPMGNAELRLTLASIENEVVESKSIILDTREQATKTNGKVIWLTKMAWLTMGALPFLTIWSGWLTKEALDRRSGDSLSREEQTAAIQAAVDQAFTDNLK